MNVNLPTEDSLNEEMARLPQRVEAFMQKYFDVLKSVIRQRRVSTSTRRNELRVDNRGRRSHAVVEHDFQGVARQQMENLVKTQLQEIKEDKMQHGLDFVLRGNYVIEGTVVLNDNTEMKYFKNVEQSENKMRSSDYSAEKCINKECPICLVPFINKENVMKLKCRHTYHYKCISQWLETHNTCPLCRFDVNKSAEFEYEYCVVAPCKMNPTIRLFIKVYPVFS